MRLLLDHLLRHGANVEMYLQDPAAAVSAKQSAKIRALLANLGEYFMSVPDRQADQLTCYTYPHRAAIRAVLIDDDMLAIGWYAYLQTAPDTSRDNSMDVQGTYVPMVQTFRGTPEWGPLRPQTGTASARRRTRRTSRPVVGQ